VNRFVPSEAETVRLIEETAKNGMAVDLSFGPSGAWIEWPKGDPEPWSVTFVKKLRGLPVAGCQGDGI
jgi:hypothetical protein